jgi:hypothetical protein
MPYQIKVTLQNNQQLHIAIENLNAENLSIFIDEFNYPGVLLDIELINVELDVNSCHILGAFLKQFELRHVCLNKSGLSVEASVALNSHFQTKENLENYCMTSAQHYYQKSRIYSNDHPYFGLYFRHAKAFEEAGQKLSASTNNNSNNNGSPLEAVCDGNHDCAPPTNNRRST